MGGKGSGTGSPNFFRCTKCRSTLRYSEENGYDVTLTGRVRAHHPPRSRGTRNAYVKVEYRCNSCGHVGWSSHIDIVERAGYGKHESLRTA
jgi:predicted RNA-binding Zn-ribbon protein involved in translation (DUF1610 family)